jgi:hypothetical protein
MREGAVAGLRVAEIVEKPIGCASRLQWQRQGSGEETQYRSAGPEMPPLVQVQRLKVPEVWREAPVVVMAKEVEQFRQLPPFRCSSMGRSHTRRRDRSGSSRDPTYRRPPEWHPRGTTAPRQSDAYNRRELEHDLRVGP